MVRQERLARGFVAASERAESSHGTVPADDGQFYIVALDPEARPGRLKFGYAVNLFARLADHKTAAPYAELLASWPAKRSWESCIMAALTLGCERVSAEVFDTPDIAATIRRAHRFMEMLPSAPTST